MNDQALKTRKQIGSILFLLIIMIMVFFIFLRGYSFQELLYTLKHIDPVYLLSGFGMMLLFIGCEALNIFMIMKVLGQPILFRRCFQYSCIGFYFSSITPSASGGQPAQIYYMKKDKIPITISSITIFFIVFVYQIAMVLMGIIMVLSQYGIAVKVISKLKYLFMIGAIVNTGVIILLFSFMFSTKVIPNLLHFLLSVLSKIRRLKTGDEMRSKLEGSMISYHEKAMALKKHPVLFFKVLFVTMIQMAAISMVPYLVYRSMGFRENSMLDLITCQSLLTISVSAIPLPGAEGIAQGGFLHVFGLFFPLNSLTSAMIINRVLSFYLPLIISFVIYIYVHIRTMSRVGQR